MQTLLLMRHAKSSWDNPAQDDHDRPLNKRGRRVAPLMGRWLREHSLTPDLIVASSARRAQETAEAVAPECGFTGDIMTAPRLYHAAPDTWHQVIRTLPESAARVLCIGHNPGIEQLLAQLGCAIPTMPTAAVAQINLPISAWSEFDPRGEFEIHGPWRPKEIGLDDDHE